MPPRQPSELSRILHAGSFLIEPTKSTPSADLCDLLVSRLSQYHSSLGHDESVPQASTLEEVQLQTAQAALCVVERVQQILDVDESNTSAPETSQTESVSQDAPSELGAPVIGTRDLAQLRTLLSITFKWGVEPLLVLITSAWPSKPSSTISSVPKIIDLTTTPEDYRRLSSLLIRLIALLFPDGVYGSLPQTLISVTIINRHLTNLLKPCVALGWLPKSLSSEATPTVNEIRPKVMRLLEILRPSQTISALGAVLSGTPPPVSHVRKTCSSLLSRQLLRPEGVVGLFAAVFGEGDELEDNVSLQRLEHVTKVLSTVPLGITPQDYFSMIVIRIVALLSNQFPLAYKRAAAFTLSHMMGQPEYSHKDLVSSIVTLALHKPFFQLLPAPETELISIEQSQHSAPTHHFTPTAALSTLMAFILHTDPSPILISTLLSPILPSLYTLSARVDRTKTADPLLKESLKGLLLTWGRVVVFIECFDTLWCILEGKGGEWEISVDGEIQKVDQKEDVTLALLTPEDIRRAEESEDLDFDSNLLDLRPDPVHFVRFLKEIDRADVSSDLFVKLLESYRDTKDSDDPDPMRPMLYLQLIIQMQTQLAEKAGSSNILNKPEHILSFIKHALTTPIVHYNSASEQVRHLTTDALKLEDLRIVPPEDDLSEEGDSDDEGSEAPGVSADAEITETAVNLLLAILEVNGELSARTAPVLNDIFSLLEPLANERSTIQHLAREARMVMTARLAFTSNLRSSKTQSKSAVEEEAHETYQRALKLLQDPILPVRAHGLLLLRQLVSPRSAGNSDKKPYVDVALAPSIISIFMQAIQDDDSYMFLNAVQGLAAMVDTFGKDVLKGLVTEYSSHLDGLAGTNLTQNDTEKRIRVGEALGQVIRRCGEALSIYVDFLVPPLIHVFRSSHIPTALRTSALSLLSDCVHTSSLAFLPYTDDLFESTIDLLQIESVSLAPKLRGQQLPKDITGSEDDQSKEAMDTRPTLVDSKQPSLRRAALHFLALLLKTSTAHIYDSTYQGYRLSMVQTKRARTTLGYVASTDEDGIVRVMAREAIEGLDQLDEAVMGL